MDKVKNLSTKTSKKNNNNITDAIKKLRETEDLLVKRQEFLETKIDRELKLAKVMCIKSKPVALQALKKKRRLESQLRQLDGTLTTIELQREALEAASTNTTVLVTMKKAADALKIANNQLNVDKVNDMVDDIAEQQDIAKEISEAISSATQQDFDEDELEKELEYLEQEALNEELLHVAPSSSKEMEELPTVPVQVVAGGQKKKKEESEPKDDDIEKLKIWAS